jgi:hypothetical protein|tara:strand:- start:171 stop:590 length:420 start_codon:yes stop_codon:yes gene_type:complete
MSRRISTFHRLALKERVLINQQMRGLGVLNKEFQRVDDMRQKLDQMTREQVPDNGEQVMATLRVTAQLNHQIRDQLETATNRCDHITQELQNMRQRIAQADRRREQSLSKANEILKQDRNERDAKREDAQASRRRPKRQ